MTTIRYAGHEAVEIEAGAVRLVVTTSVGPRVLALLTEDGANAFVEVPEMTLSPGQKRQIRVWLIRGTKGVVVLGGFCKTDPQCPSWYHVATWSGYDNLIVKLDAGATCFTVSKR